MEYNGVEIEEFYAKIPGCSNYLISNKGKVYSSISNKIIKPYLHNKMYPRIELKGDDGSTRKYFIHRLVVEVFGDKNMNKALLPGYDIDHIDRDKLNNSINNLEIVDHKENMHRWQKNKNNTST